MITQKTHPLTVVTQNVWGGVPGWERRRPLLAAAIARHRPDVIGLQEVHGSESDNQAEEVARLLGGYTAHFAPGRRNAAGGHEGVALLCKSTVHERAVRALTLDSADPLDRNNQRVVLCARVEVGSRRVDVLVTHLSLSARARLRTVVEVLDFAEAERRRARSSGAILLGDFNAPSGEEAIVEIESATRRERPWCDAWKAAHGPYARGGTWPAIMPVRRIDYVFFQPPSEWAVESCQRLSFAGSDHLGVAAHLRLDVGPGARPSSHPPRPPEA